MDEEMETHTILLEIRSEQERQRHDLEAIKETLGVLGGRDKLASRINAEKALRRHHDRKGMDAVRRFRAGKNTKRTDKEKTSE